MSKPEVIKRVFHKLDTVLKNKIAQLQTSNAIKQEKHNLINSFSTARTELFRLQKVLLSIANSTNEQHNLGFTSKKHQPKKATVKSWKANDATNVELVGDALKMGKALTNEHKTSAKIACDVANTLGVAKGDHESISHLKEVASKFDEAGINQVAPECSDFDHWKGDIRAEQMVGDGLDFAMTLKAVGPALNTVQELSEGHYRNAAVEAGVGLVDVITTPITAAAITEGAYEGAMLGMAFGGPIGAAIGGVLGGAGMYVTKKNDI